MTSYQPLIKQEQCFNDWLNFQLNCYLWRLLSALLCARSIAHCWVYSNYKTLDCRSFQILGSYLNSSLVPANKIDREQRWWVIHPGNVLQQRWNKLLWLDQFLPKIPYSDFLDFVIDSLILGQLYFWPDMPPKKIARSFNDNGQITKRRLLQFHSISSILPSQLVVSTVIPLNGNGCAK